jgi:hypothetical protein
MPNLVLEIIEGPSAGATFELTSALEIGRDPSASVVLDDGQVSRHHARFTPSATGVVLQDLGSSNGTYLNDSPIDGPRELRHGDHVRAGVTVFEVRDPAAGAVPGVLPVPAITELGAQVLNPVAERELVAPQRDPALPALRVAESDPGYVPGGRAGNLPPVGGGLAVGGAALVPAANHEAGDQYKRVAALRDPRVKPQTRQVAAVFLAIAALAIVVYFGVTT